MGKPGRPKKSELERRRERLEILMNVNERYFLGEAAKRVGLAPAVYARSVILREAGRVLQ